MSDEWNLPERIWIAPSRAIFIQDPQYPGTMEFVFAKKLKEAERNISFLESEREAMIAVGQEQALELGRAQGKNTRLREENNLLRARVSELTNPYVAIENANTLSVKPLSMADRTVLATCLPQKGKEAT